MPGDLPCKRDKDIHKFISRIEVETWSFFHKIDFSDHSRAPYIKTEKFLKTDMLDPIKS